MPRDILLVGGVGLDSAEDVFRTLGKELGPRVKRLTDGETGFARSVWIQCQKPFFFGHPLLEDMEPDPDKPGELRPPECRRRASTRTPHRDATRGGQGSVPA